MSIYQTLARVGSRFFGQAALFKYGFNLTPMYRRSTGRIVSVSDDLMQVRIKVPISYKNKNYVSSIFGGSMFSAVDPIPMVQLINLLGDNYVVWDKSAQIYFKRPARQDIYADFEISTSELDEIKNRVAQQNEIEIVKVTQLTDESRATVFCEVHKTIYIADKAFYKEKRRKRSNAQTSADK